MIKRLLLLTLILLPVRTLAEGPSFIFELAGEERTIGDIKPVFIVFKEKELPDVSIEYAMKRYIKLFETSSSPEVKIDALNRINNLSAKYGVSSKKLTIDKKIQSQVLLESYDSIMDSGIFYDRMDELLYQTAKATSFTGNKEDAIKRLKLLVGLYPNSPLVDESTFRMGEAYFSLGEYAQAEAQYKKLLAFSQTDEFHTRAKFKLGWSVFRQDRFEESVGHAFAVLSEFPELQQQNSIAAASEEQHDLIEDTLRLMSILFANQDGADSIMVAQQKLGSEAYAYLLHDALFRFYLKQDRFEEAAVVAANYAAAYNDRYDAYLMALYAIDAYRKGDFEIQSWNAKEDFVANFGVQSHYWGALTDTQRESVRPHQLTYTQELAHLYFVRMQQARGKPGKGHAENGQRSANYYLSLTELDAGNANNGRFVYLAAEALRDTGRYEGAIALYERSAYAELPHEKSNTAAYAAILSFDELAGANNTLKPEQIARKHENILRFADRYPDDTHTPDLLNYLANALFDAGAFDQAVVQAARVLQQSSPDTPTYYSSLLVAAHSQFELERFDAAEQYYAKAVAHARSAESRDDLRERLALSIYRQAERESDVMLSAEMFLRVADVVPASSIVPQALYDASAQFLAAQSWSEAIASLSYLQEVYPKHELYSSASEKLIFAFQENGDWVAAADKLVERSDSTADAVVASQSLFQAAEYYQQSGLMFQATETYQRFVSRYPDQFELNMEAYDRIASYFMNSPGNAEQEAGRVWSQKLVSYEADNRSRRTLRSAGLAAKTSFTLALRPVEDFRKVRLVTPLKQSLQKKRALLDKAVAALQGVAKYEIQEWQSAATYEIAGLYRVLAKDLLASERPASLDELQREQYDILLEEQAYPFEEQALAIYQVNTDKVAEGVYDDWIEQSYSALAEMNPTQYQREWMEPDYAESIF